MEDLGYRTHNTLINLSSLVVYIFAILSCMGVYLALSFAGLFIPKAPPTMMEGGTPELPQSRSFSCTSCFKRYMRTARKHLFFRWLFSLILFGFMEFTIAGYLGLGARSDETFNESFSTFLAYCCLIATLFLLPLYYISLQIEGNELS